MTRILRYLVALAAALLSAACVYPSPASAQTAITDAQSYNGNDPPPAGCQMLDRACWEAKRAGVVGPDAGGYDLTERNRMCEEMLYALDDTAQDALRHLYARHQTFSPTGRGVDYDNPTNGVGYIDSGDIAYIEREINTIVNVTVRDVRYARYDGANLDRCATLVHEAQVKIEQIKAALP